MSFNVVSSRAFAWTHVKKIGKFQSGKPKSFETGVPPSGIQCSANCGNFYRLCL